MDLDKHQAQTLARFVIENNDRLDLIHLQPHREGVICAEAAKGGKITATTWLYEGNKAVRT